MASKQFEKSVFINCPFDSAYRPMFRAAVFAVVNCGFVPRCALEISDAADVRIEKICRIIEESKFGFHDISRVELDASNGLPRFNMPFELGLFLGCRRYGDRRQRTKSCVVFDTDQYRYQRFISDISGQDISAHGDEVSQLITKMRDWLSAHAGDLPLLGGQALFDRYKAFTIELPTICRSLRLDEPALTFADLVFVIREASQ